MLLCAAGNKSGCWTAGQNRSHVVIRYLFAHFVFEILGQENSPEFVPIVRLAGVGSRYVLDEQMTILQDHPFCLRRFILDDKLDRSPCDWIECLRVEIKAAVLELLVGSV